PGISVNRQRSQAPKPDGYRGKAGPNATVQPTPWSKRTRSMRSASKVYVIGAGGIGCAVGYALLQAGIEVVFVEISKDKIEWGNRHGVKVDDRNALPATFIDFENCELSDDSTVILCTKCYDNAAVLQRIQGASRIIPIQNGFDSVILKASRIEGISSFVSECRPDRPHTRITRAGDLHIGGRGPDPSDMPSELEPVIQAWEQFDAFKVKRVRDVLPYKYSKLLYNAAISPLAAVAGLDNSALLTLPKARSLFFRILQENYRILKKAGVPLGVIGPFHPDTVNLILRLPFLARLMAGPFARSLRNTYCSMSGEIPTGRTEIDYFNGHLLALASDGEAILNRLCHKQVQAMAERREMPSMGRLDELLQQLQDQEAQ
ncbi:MAG: 2-dehydropantoate 2-reductase N-terminal domain-containing protein, partial [Rhodospirillales bacterium]